MEQELDAFGYRRRRATPWSPNGAGSDRFHEGRKERETRGRSLRPGHGGPWVIETRPATGCLDEAALTAIYDLHHKAIYRYIYRQVGEVEAARDLTADVFQRLVQATQQPGEGSDAGPAGHVPAWLFRTARNVVVDFYRRQSFRRHLPLNETMVDHGADPTEDVERRLAVARVREALIELPDEQKDVILLKFLDGMSNQEVAQTLEKTVGAVKSLQHRALAALQRRLVGREEEKA